MIIKYLFSHSLHCNLEYIYICKFLYDNVATELVFGLDGNLELCDLVTAWRTCRGSFHYVARCSTGTCKKKKLMCLTV